MQKIILEGKTILITGSAGFIGANLVKRLFTELNSGCIVGIDNMNAYYDIAIKEYRLREIESLKPDDIEYHFIKGDIADNATIKRIFAEYKPSIVVNLAAQAGVRYSITNPEAYIQSNLIGFYNILEACRHSKFFPFCNKQQGISIHSCVIHIFAVNNLIPHSALALIHRYRVINLYSAACF
jgi:UDP-glucuronate 4-epimerase